MGLFLQPYESDHPEILLSRRCLWNTFAHGNAQAMMKHVYDSHSEPLGRSFIVTI